MNNIQKDFEAGVIHVREIAWRSFCCIHFAYRNKTLGDWQLEESLKTFDNNFKEAEFRGNKKKCFDFIHELEDLTPRAENRKIFMFLAAQTIMWTHMILSHGSAGNCRFIRDITYDSTDVQEELSSGSRAGSAEAVKRKKES